MNLERYLKYFCVFIYIIMAINYATGNITAGEFYITAFLILILYAIISGTMLIVDTIQVLLKILALRD